MLKRKIGTVFLCFWAAIAPARAGEVWFKNVSVDVLENLYNDVGYNGMRGYLMLDTHEYPRIFMKNFPKDYEKVVEDKKRAELFIKILAPMALKINEDILKERKKLLEVEQKFVEQKKLGTKDKNLLEAKAKKYDVFTRLKDEKRYSYLVKELVKKVDVIPPSIMIVTAAIETNWGASRIVKEANSLYKKLVWHTKEGLKPMGETEDDSYRIKKYDDIYASMQEFALKFNSALVYRAMRNYRYELKSFNGYLLGTVLAPYVFGSSEMKNYAGVFDYTVAYYELMEIDKSTLADNMIPQEVVKKYGSYIVK